MRKRKERGHCKKDLSLTLHIYTELDMINYVDSSSSMISEKNVKRKFDSLSIR